MAKTKVVELTTYDVSLRFKCPVRGYGTNGYDIHKEIKAANVEEAKKIFITYLTERDMTINILLAIDSEIEKKLLNSINCEDLSILLANKTKEAESLMQELKSALTNISAANVSDLKDKYSIVREYKTTFSGDKTFTDIVKQCDVLLEAVDKCSKI